jgi:hypothetical protein
MATGRDDLESQVKAKQEKILKQEIAKAKQLYNEYAVSQKGFKAPIAEISIETAPEGDSVEVHAGISYNGITLNFESIKKQHARLVYKYLFSQEIVRKKFATGLTMDEAPTYERVEVLSNRFALNELGEPKDKNLHLYGGFFVSNAESNEFLGICNSGANEKEGQAEIAFFNRQHTWSKPPVEIEEDYELVFKKGSGFISELRNNSKQSKKYSGVATAEILTMVQYSQFLRDKGYKIKGGNVDAVVMTARVDNPGSWKAAAKAGMEVNDVDQKPSYGPELRYQLGIKLI